MPCYLQLARKSIQGEPKCDYSGNSENMHQEKRGVEWRWLAGK